MTTEQYRTDKQVLSAAPAMSDVDLPDVEDLAHSCLQEALSFGLDHDVIHRWMRAVMDKTAAAMLAASPTPPAEQQAAPKAAPAPLSDDVVKDAARYRWLRNKSTVLHGTAWLGSATAYQRDVDFLRRDDALAALDAAIDATLAAQGGSNAE